MKTLKERIAPYLQALGKLRRDRRFYEACSVPWFVFDCETKSEAVPFAQLKLPFQKMVLVIVVRENQFPVYLETGGPEGLWGAAVLNNGMWFCWRGKTLTSFCEGISMDFARNSVAAIMATVRSFAGAVWDPGVHLATVRPVNGMRSVEWIKAREHYVLLHRSHPANNADAAGGRTIEYDEREVLRRMAHRVRAHVRLLRSPRFRHKRGQAVPVREQWRGPKEWVNKRSRQTYRWIDKATLTPRPHGN